MIMIPQTINEDEKRKRIVEDFSRNMFIEAGAGAGKTTLIVSRIVNMLKADYDPSEIVVITFTNKAAEELKSRISDRVKEASDTDPGLKDKLYRLDEMNISTIHSFCNVLLREQGGAAGLPQDLILIQDNEEKQFKRGFLNDYMRTLTNDDWDKLEKEKDPNENRRQIRSYIEELFMSICDLPKDVSIVLPEERKSKGEIIHSVDCLIMGNSTDNIPGISDVLIREAASCFDPEKNTGDKAEQITTAAELIAAGNKKLASQKTLDILNGITEGDDGTEYDIDDIVKALDSKAGFFNTSSLPVRYDKEKVKEANNRLKEMVEKGLSPARPLWDLGKKDKDAAGNTIERSFSDAIAEGGRIETHFRTLVSYAEKARDYYHKNRPANKITNDNLLELTRDLILGENTAPLDYFRSKYRAFFVDEFQDTDSLQASFIYKLAEEPSASGELQRLKDGALFVVGDPKQSIYRFRGAEPEVYFLIKEKMEKLDNADVYELARNYRSNEAVISWVNEKFRESDEYYHIVNTEVNGTVYAYSPMEVVNTSKPTTSGELISGIYCYDNPDNERYIDKSKPEYAYSSCDTETDVENLIKVVKELTSPDNDYKITRYKKSGAEFEAFAEKIKYSDFLIISPGMKKMDEYVTALKKNGIPVVIDGSVSLTRDKVLNVFSRIYGYLINPRNPFYRVAATEAIRESAGWKNEEEVFEYADKILDCLYADCRKMTPYGKAHYLEGQTSVLFDKDRDISAIEVHTARTHIRQMLESINADIIGTGEDIIEEMKRYTEAGLEHEMSLEESPDAVRFMNLHKSKGLEGNIVILLDRRGKYDPRPVSLRIGNKFYPGVDPKYGRKWSSVAGVEKLEKQFESDERSEFHRLEYVAVTRAKQAVIFMDVISDGKRYMRRLFAQGKLTSDKKKIEKGYYSYNIKECDQIFDTSKVVLPGVPKLEFNEYRSENDDYPRTREEKVKDPVSYRKINPSGLEKKTSAVKERAKREAINNGKSADDEKSKVLERPTGNYLGDALHNAMELIVNALMEKHYEDSNALVNYCSKRAVMNMLRKNELDNDFPDRDKYLKFIEACGKAYISWLTDASGDVYLDNVERAYTELPFSYSRENTEGKKEWHNGSADLIFKNKDGSFTLIDYKSDNDILIPEDIMHESFREKYSPQLEEYRNVIQKLFNADPDRIHTLIISFSQKDENGNMLDGDSVRIRCTEI